MFVEDERNILELLNVTEAGKVTVSILLKEGNWILCVNVLGRPIVEG